MPPWDLRGGSPLVGVAGSARRRSSTHKEHVMTRARRIVGRIAFVGAGPGDPGLLTMRAAEALASASVVVTDPDVPEDVTAMAAGADIRPAVGEPADVARTLITAARTGQFVVRLVAGDVLTADPV